MKRARIGSSFLIAVGLSAVLASTSFGAVYQKSEKRYPEGPVMIVLDSAASGKYALGLDGDQWIVQPLADITAINNDDPRFLFTFEPREKNSQWEESSSQWEANHLMAIHGVSGYLDFDAVPENFLNAVPRITAEPSYHWQYKIYDSQNYRANLYFKGSYETAGLGGALWVKANAKTTTIKMVTGGKGPNTYLYEEAEGAEAAEPSGGWQEYKKSDQTCWKYVNGDGSLKQSEWYEENGRWYYFGSDGVTLMGFHQLPDGNSYYFKSDASMMTNSEISVRGVPYRIGGDGICRAVPEDSPARKPISMEQSGKEDELLNWINLKRSEMGLQPLYRDNRLSEIAYEISTVTNEIVDWQTLHAMGQQQGIEFTKRFNLRMNWNEEYKNMRLEDYYKDGSLSTFVNEPDLNHIGVYIRKSLYTSTCDCILVGGRYE